MDLLYIFLDINFCYINYALHVRAIVVTLGRNCRKICTRVTTIILLGLEEPLILLTVQYYETRDETSENEEKEHGDEICKKTVGSAHERKRHEDRE